jgi:hypothetical protein
MDACPMSVIVEMLAKLKVDNERSYNDLIEELSDNVNMALSVLSCFELKLTMCIGEYGSITPGIGGYVYTDVRSFLLKEKGKENMPTLRGFLTAPVENLPDYTGNTGAGGKGPDTQKLNICWVNVRGCIQRALGMLLVIQKNNQPA